MEKRKKPEFIRTDGLKKDKLKGKGWRRARGRHNKIRQKRNGHPRAPTVGYGQPREIRGLVGGMSPRLIQNVSDLSLVGKNEIGVVASQIGAKKRMEIAEKALKMDVKLENMNAQKFLDEMKKASESKKKTAEPAKKEEKKEDKK